MVVTQNKLWFTVNQYWLCVAALFLVVGWVELTPRSRQPTYQNGTDKRTKPFALLSVAIDAGPVRLK
jgi:hypothetical protein